MSANYIMISGGMQLDTLIKAIFMVKEYFTHAACTLDSYDPNGDPDGHVANVSIRI